VSLRILAVDALPESFAQAVAAAGHTCVLEPGLDAETLVGQLSGVDVLVVRSTRVSAAAFASADRLRLVVRAGSGTNTIDCAAATEHGVLVANVPGRNAVAVAELTMGLLLAVDRAIPDNVAELRSGQWDKTRFSQGARGLYGRSMGIVGLGHIGWEVAVRAQAFGVRVSCLPSYSPAPERDWWVGEMGLEIRSTLLDLAAAVDVLTLHLPMTAATQGLVDSRVLDALAPGILINTARADLVDNDALLSHLDHGTLAAGLDVFPDEPATGATAWESRLAQHPRVVGTHHIGASTEQAQSAVEAGVLEVIAAFADGSPTNVVNRP
jgi:D-3-phosphoglycerate dehydrogenase / 2-oxoglutarate reductase